MHQPVRKRIATGVILLTVLVLLLFSARNLFVRKYIDRKLEKIEEVRRLSIHYDDIHMLGLSGIHRWSICNPAGGRYFPAKPFFPD